jgi:hypothetical protein
MPRLLLYPFRFRDRVTRKWIRARYVAEREVIAARYAEWEIAGPPEVPTFNAVHDISAHISQPRTRS